MAAWRDSREGGSGRASDSRGPQSARAGQGTGPGGNWLNGITPDPEANREGESPRLYRRARVTAS